MMKMLLFVGVTLVVIGLLGTLYLSRSQPTDGVLEETRREPVDSLYVSGENVQIDVIASSDNTTRITYSGLSESALREQFSLEQVENHLTISIDASSRWSFFNFGFFTSTPTLTIALPQIELTEIRGKTTNGRLSIKDHAIKTLDFQTNNGRVTLERTHTYDARVKTNNGSITLEDVSGKIHAETNNGSIKAFNLIMDDDLSLSTSNGSITATLAKLANTTIDADTRNGSVTLLGNKASQLIYGESTSLLHLRTHNGSIKVEEAH